MESSINNLTYKVPGRLPDQEEEVKITKEELEALSQTNTQIQRRVDSLRITAEKFDPLLLNVLARCKLGEYYTRICLYIENQTVSFYIENSTNKPFIVISDIPISDENKGLIEAVYNANFPVYNAKEHKEFTFQKRTMVAPGVYEIKTTPEEAIVYTPFNKKAHDDKRKTSNLIPLLQKRPEIDKTITISSIYDKKNEKANQQKKEEEHNENHQNLEGSAICTEIDISGEKYTIKLSPAKVKEAIVKFEKMPTRLKKVYMYRHFGTECSSFNKDVRRIGYEPQCNVTVEGEMGVHYIYKDCTQYYAKGAFKQFLHEENILYEPKKSPESNIEKTSAECLETKEREKVN